MTPKEKALELIGKFCGNDCRNASIERVQKYALIAVGEILNTLVCSQTDYGASILYWKQVKQEIQLL
jgi:hypothetical protein